MTRVLLVEDDGDLLCVLQMELEWMGYEVDASTDGPAALALARRARPDVIVSDLDMPGMNGLEFIQRIREIDRLASVPAIALSGASLDQELRQALVFGFNTYLTKPVDTLVLDKQIRQLTARWLERRAS